MGYADYKFYKENYYGEVLENEIAPRWLEVASDTLDSITYGRLTYAFPVNKAHAVKVKKAVCAIADALYCVDIQKKSASASKNESGEIHGAVSSISSGRESVSYSVNGSASVYALAAADQSELQKLLIQTTLIYLAGIPDANGINLLYGGF